MRDDLPKLRATQKEGAKREAKELQNRRQPQSPAKARELHDEAGQGVVRRRDGGSDRATRQ